MTIMSRLQDEREVFPLVMGEGPPQVQIQDIDLQNGLGFLDGMDLFCIYRVVEMPLLERPVMESWSQ